MRTKSVTKGSSRSNNRFAKTIQKVISLKSATNKFASNNALFLLTTTHHETKNNEESSKARTKRRGAVMEALIARLFAGVTTIKASYAELQMAQQPYNNEAIQKADQAVVDELISISELKKRFFKKELNISSPQVTLMLAQLQEQQSLMKTFQITIEKLQSLVDAKESEISSLKKELHECIAFNKSLEKKFQNLHLSELNTTHFIHFLQHTLRSMKSFTKLMIKEMESSNWDLELAVKCIQPDAVFIKQSHQCYAFESFVNMTMFEGFNYKNFSVPSESPLQEHHNRNLHLENFKRCKSLNTKHYDPNSSFARFLKSKYLQVVHAKMECSFFGNLNHRKLLNNGGVPDSAFFIAFAEMAKRVWCLHCLALSFDEDVRIFQVKKNTRFSEAYMECEAEQVSDSDSGELRVGFTVVPGFMIGKSVIQSQVYLSPIGQLAPNGGKGGSTVTDIVPLLFSNIDCGVSNIDDHDHDHDYS
ncbi:hypothetical protein PIB30_002301 [Stylosanthes scabra]|uniref:DUF641 domain-containing protein n=1 Tax=Stylosanthes scabra TaxID=79078 RepID=A0ABU6U1X0_9FABA|nr:hypothetical protein [Stylosanthes scabra]